MIINSFLLDTHVFIWAMEGNSRLPEKLKKTIIDPQNKVLISVVSLWEIIIKEATKQIKFDFEIEASIKKAGFDVLPIEISHVIQIKELQQYHNDPFDRMLVAQTIVEKLTLITSDEKIWQYKCPVIKV